MTKLCTELAHHPKIKVVTLLNYYNFVLGCTSMQSFQNVVQLQSNLAPKIGTIHYKYDLEVKLALVMNTKIVPSNILNMIEAFLRFHNHLIHCLHVNPRSNSAYHHLGA